jgi:hypothetical protein
MSTVAFYMSTVAFYMSPVAFYMSTVAFYMSTGFWRQKTVTFYMSPKLNMFNFGDMSTVYMSPVAVL